jgi:Asp-tRNA(Asn)/Glu-tRNA(Gln) amidotransferase A subunit family amidase
MPHLTALPISPASAASLSEPHRAGARVSRSPLRAPSTASRWLTARAALHVLEGTRSTPQRASMCSLSSADRLPPLAGVPIVIKGRACTPDMPSTAGRKDSGRLDPAL